MTIRHTIPMAFAALALVSGDVRPLAAQQVLASSTVVSDQIQVQPESLATPEAPQVAPADPSAGFTPRNAYIGVALGYLIPGGGQFYAGKPMKGAALLGISVGALAVGELSCDRGSDVERCVGNGLLAIGAILGAWSYGMISAPGDVREYNDQHARRVNVAPVVDRHSGRTGLGLAIRY
jgi:hypothetical protein